MTILLAPVAQSENTRLGPRVYRKQVLRPMELSYNGRKIKFDEAYFRNIEQAFQKGAFDTVPFVLADKENRHTMEPERAAGEVLGLEASADGLYATIRLSEDAAKIVADNPRFGVSARIVEGLARGDGFTAPAAVQHVLGTFDPRVTGLSPWETVELSNENQEVIDLTKTEEGAVDGLTEAQQKRIEALLAMPDEEFAALLDADDSTTAPEDEPENEPEDSEDDGNEDAPQQEDLMSDEELIALLAEDKEPVALSNE